MSIVPIEKLDKKTVSAIIDVLGPPYSITYKVRYVDKPRPSSLAPDAVETEYEQRNPTKEEVLAFFSGTDYIGRGYKSEEGYQTYLEEAHWPWTGGLGFAELTEYGFSMTVTKQKLKKLTKLIEIPKAQITISFGRDVKE